MLVSLFVTLLAVGFGTDGHQNVRKKRQIMQDKPRLLTENGNLVFQCANNKNIHFRTSDGGGIYLGADNLVDIAEMAKGNAAGIERLKSSAEMHTTNASSRLQAMESRLNNLQPTGEVQSSLTSLESRLSRLESRVTSIFRILGSDDDAGLRRKVQSLETTVHTLQQLLTTNECQSNPCQNGGTCVDSYNSFLCQCPPNWQGVTCSADVNECSEYAGTDIGCQNGATCVNLQGSFR